MVSSPLLTFIVKVIAPILAMIGVFVVIHFMLFGIGDPSLVTPPPIFRALAIFTTIGLAALIVWSVSCIVVVKLENEFLLLSTYMTTIKVPFKNVKTAAAADLLFRGLGLRYLGIEFGEPIRELRHSRFSGKQIRFITRGPVTADADHLVLQALNLSIRQTNCAEAAPGGVIDAVKK